MAYQMVATAVILNDLEDHSPPAGVFKCNLSNICAAFYTILTDCVLARFLCISRASWLLLLSLAMSLILHVRCWLYGRVYYSWTSYADWCEVLWQRLVDRFCRHWSSSRSMLVMWSLTWSTRKSATSTTSSGSASYGLSLTHHDIYTATIETGLKCSIKLTDFNVRLTKFSPARAGGYRGWSFCLRYR